MRVQKTKRKCSPFVRIIAILCAVLICVNLVPVNIWAVGDVEKEQAVDTLDNSNTDDGTGTTPGTDDGTGTTPGTDDGTGTTPDTDDGTGTTPGTDDGTGTTPGTDDGTGTTPGTDDGTGTTPGTDDGTGTTPDTDDGTGTTPDTDDGTGTTPGTDDGTGTTPGTDDGTGTTPGTDDGTGTTPGTDDGTGTTPDTDDGTGTTPGTDDGTGTTPDQGSGEGTTPKTFMVTKSVEGGEATVSGSDTVEKGTNYSFKVTAANGYQVDKVVCVVGDGDEKELTKDANGDYTIDKDQIDDDIKITVFVSEVKYSIEFYTPLGNAPKAIEYTVAQLPSKFEEPELNADLKDHYEFEGWYQEGENGLEKIECVTEDNMQDLVLYANWTVTSFDYSEAAIDGKLCYAFDLGLDNDSDLHKNTVFECELTKFGNSSTDAPIRQNAVYDEKESRIILTSDELSSGLYQVEVKKVQQKVTVNNYTYELNTSFDDNILTSLVDQKAPVIKEIDVSVNNTNKFVEWINKVLFGKDDANENAVITVTVTDEVPSSGIASVSLKIDNGEGITGKLEKQAKEEGSDTVTTVATFEYPIKELDANRDIKFIFEAEDKIGLTSSVEASGEDVQNAINSRTVLYDNVPPVISNNLEDISENLGTTDAPKYWVVKDGNIAFTLSDPDGESNAAILNYAGLASGEVIVSHDEKNILELKWSVNKETGTVNWGESADQQQTELIYDEAGTDQKIIQTATMTVNYGQLSCGENEITVTAVDNAGNSKQYFVTVNKDEHAPVVKDETADYFEADGVKWIEKGDTVVRFAVSDDPRAAGSDCAAASISGVASVTVCIQGEGEDEKIEVENGSEDQAINVSTSAVTIPYNRLYEGKNTITVTATDLVGNENAADNQTYVVYKDTGLPTGSIDLPDENYQNGEERWYNSDTLEQGELKINTDDTPEGENSGVKYFQVWLNDNNKPVYDSTDDPSGENVPKTLDELGDLQEGVNTVKLLVWDNVGNCSNDEGITISQTFYVDTQAPQIQTIKVKENLTFFSWIGKYLFGIKTIGNYSLTIACQDQPTEGSSGVGTLKIWRTVREGEREAITQNSEYDAERGEFEVALETLLLANQDTQLTFAVVDNVGNESAPVDATKEEIEGAVEARTFLFDNQEPDVSCNIDTVQGEESESLWVVKDGNIDFTLSDPDGESNAAILNYAGLASGEVIVSRDEKNILELKWSVNKETGTVNWGESADQQQTELIYGEAGTDQKIIQTATMTINYGQLSCGENEITVTAVDNAGNSKQYSVTVYKDEHAPMVTDATADYFEADGVKWIEKGEAVQFAVSDDPRASGSDCAAAPISGVASVTVCIQGEGEDEKIEVKNGSEDQAINVSTSAVTIPYDRLYEGKNTITVTATDLVGNENAADNQTYVVCKDTGLPTGSIDLPDENYQNGEERWYNSDTLEQGELKINTDDTPEGENSGVKYFQVWLNDNDKPVYDSTHDPSGENVPKTLDGLGDLQEGVNTVKLLVWDNVGNCSNDEGITISQTFYVDTKSPCVKRFDFQPEGNEYGNGDPVKTGTYGYFFSRSTNVTVTVYDGEKSSGIGTIYFLTKDVNGTIKTSSKTITGSGTTATFTVAAGFKGEIYASVADRVGNTPSEGTLNRGELNYVRPENTVIESQDEHAHYSDIEIALPGTGNQDSKNQNLYSGDVTVPITVTDIRSGIQHVKVTVTAAYGEKRESSYELDIGHDGAVGNGWTKASGESNLVYEVTRNITVTNNSNDITIRVELTDQAGNTSEEEAMLSIDKSQPEITVVFDNNDVLNERYFKADRSATITVRDANFNGADVVCSQTGAALNFGGGMGDWAQTGPDQNGIYTYTLTRTFAEDGDYLFNMSVTDRAGNQTNDNQVQYTGAAVHDFVVDKTMPELQMSLGNAFSNGHYLKADDQMVITITEHNFDAAGYAATARFVNVNDQTQAFLTNGTWSGNGDVYSAAFPVEEEGTYYVESVTFTDLAGNVVTVQGGELGYGLFELDKTAPAIQIRNGMDGEEINGTANQGDVNPVVVISDENFSSNDVSVTLTAYRQDANLETYTTQQPLVTQENGEGGYVAFTNFLEQEGADNIYTITVMASDLAGNPTPYTATFSVNRFGSTYMLPSATHETVEQHWINGAWLEEMENVEIVEINPDRLNSRQVTITRGNEILTLEEGVDYQVVEQVPTKQGDNDYQTTSHWYEYTYLIPVSNFEQEGAYTIGLMSLDEAENQQTNEATGHATNLFSEMGNELVYDESSATAKVTFVVDKTSPVNTITGLEESSYIENEHSFSVISQDETMLDRAEVYLDGELVQTVYEEELAESGYQFEYTLNSKNTHQTVQIVAYDKAGNQSDVQADQYRVLVTTNLWVQFVNSLAAIIIAMIVVALIVVCIVVLAKKKKKQGGKQAV